jgi:hypothetical protein
METVDVLMKMPKIEGYEYTGEFRLVLDDEFFLSDASGSVRQCGTMCSPGSARPILRKAQVWKKLTLEKALEMGKTRNKFTFRLALGHSPSHFTTFKDTVDYIDLHPATRANVRMGYYGWGCTSDIEYLED